MRWQAIDERDYWDGLTNGKILTRAAGVVCPMAWLLLADGTDASPDTGEWAAVVLTTSGPTASPGRATSRRLPSFHTARGGRGHRGMPW
jgi:hypothetical protein